MKWFYFNKLEIWKFNDDAINAGLSMMFCVIGVVVVLLLHCENWFAGEKM